MIDDYEKRLVDPELKYTNGRSNLTQLEKLVTKRKIDGSFLLFASLVTCLLLIIFGIQPIDASQEVPTQKSQKTTDEEFDKTGLKKLEKIGFKKLEFGMSFAEVTKLYGLEGKIEENRKIKRKSTIYEKGPLTKIGNYSLQSAELIYFNDKLYLIKLTITSKHEQIFKTLKFLFGAPSMQHVQTDARHSVFATWLKNTDTCVFFGEKSSNQEIVWEGITFYDNKTLIKAELIEPMKASKNANY